jgi:signal transduction histidine kinase
MSDSVSGSARAASGVDSGTQSGSTVKALSKSRMSRWIGWRPRILVGLTLVGCVLIFMVARGLSGLAYFGGDWHVNSSSRLELQSASDARLRPFVMMTLSAISAAGIVVDLRDATLVQRSARWLISDAQRAQQLVLHQQLAEVSAKPDCTLRFAGGETVACAAAARGYSNLADMFWVLAASALILYLVAMVVLLVRPSGLNLLYASVALCQAGNLLFSAVDATLDLGVPGWFLAGEFTVRAAFDLFTAAAVVHVVSIHPLPLPLARRWAISGWVIGTVAFAALASGLLSNRWWWLQAVTTLLGLAVIFLLTWSYRLEPRPLAIALRRFSVLTVGAWVLLSVGLAATSRQAWIQANIASLGTLFWYLALAGALMLTPFLSRSQLIMREFGLLAAISALATLLDLLFIGAFSLSPLSSGAFSLFIALATYLAARQWLLNRLLGTSMITTERMFEQLYRIARDVEAHPERAPTLLAELLQELFDPVELGLIEDPVTRARITDDGSTLLVPVPALAADEQGHDGAIVLRFAQQGKRLFTADDLRLTDRIVEQLERAVAYDRAVERGRGEERMRLAQDLHDDIGARLLTLIYKAQSPEMEEYARHTLQDLKTLTRGLAAPSHRLSHAAGEWKADLANRLSAANIDLGWSCEFDDDLMLTVVQWSAVTRVMRELVSNTIAHSGATRVEVAVRLVADCLQVSVCDDGNGRSPKAWSHGLGLGGVRKRVKQLGGQVEWIELSPRGICCQVMVRELSKHG